MNKRGQQQSLSQIEEEEGTFQPANAISKLNDGSQCVRSRQTSYQQQDSPHQSNSQQSRQEDSNSGEIQDKDVLVNARKHLHTFLDTIGQKLKMEKVNKKEIKDLLKLQPDPISSFDVFINLYENDIKKMETNRQIKKNWNKDDILLLIWIVQKYCQHYQVSLKNITENDWLHISKIMPGKTTDSCKFKWLQMTKNNVSMSPWISQEDDILLKIVNQYPSQWVHVSKLLYKEMQSINSEKAVFRTSKQCREHYNNFLDPNLKRSKWTDEEDKLLLELQIKMGNKWSLISKQIPGRTDNSVKNRFMTIKNRSCNQNNNDFMQNSSNNNNNEDEEENGIYQTQTNSEHQNNGQQQQQQQQQFQNQNQYQGNGQKQLPISQQLQQQQQILLQQQQNQNNGYQQYQNSNGFYTNNIKLEAKEYQELENVQEEDEFRNQDTQYNLDQVSQNNQLFQQNQNNNIFNVNQQQKQPFTKIEDQGTVNNGKIFDQNNMNSNYNMQQEQRKKVEQIKTQNDHLFSKIKKQDNDSSSEEEDEEESIEINQEFNGKQQYQNGQGLQQNGINQKLKSTDKYFMQQFSNLDITGNSQKQNMSQSQPQKGESPDYQNYLIPAFIDPRKKIIYLMEEETQWCQDSTGMKQFQFKTQPLTAQQKFQIACQQVNPRSNKKNIIRRSSLQSNTSEKQKLQRQSSLNSENSVHLYPDQYQQEFKEMQNNKCNDSIYGNGSPLSRGMQEELRSPLNYNKSNIFQQIRENKIKNIHPLENCLVGFPLRSMESLIEEATPGQPQHSSIFKSQFNLQQNQKQQNQKQSIQFEGLQQDNNNNVNNLGNSPSNKYYKKNTTSLWYLDAMSPQLPNQQNSLLKQHQQQQQQSLTSGNNIQFLNPPNIMNQGPLGSPMHKFFNRSPQLSSFNIMPPLQNNNNNQNNNIEIEQQLPKKCSIQENPFQSQMDIASGQGIPFSCKYINSEAQSPLQQFLKSGQGSHNTVNNNQNNNNININNHNNNLTNNNNNLTNNNNKKNGIIQESPNKYFMDTYYKQVMSQLHQQQQGQPQQQNSNEITSQNQQQFKYVKQSSNISNETADFNQLNKSQDTQQKQSQYQKMGFGMQEDEIKESNVSNKNIQDNNNINNGGNSNKMQSEENNFQAVFLNGNQK